MKWELSFFLWKNVYNLYFSTKDYCHVRDFSVFLSFLFKNREKFLFLRELLFHFEGSPKTSALLFALSKNYSGYLYETCAGLLFLSLRTVGLDENLSIQIISFTLQNRVPVSKLYPQNDTTSIQTHKPQPRILWHGTKLCLRLS